jgi:glycerol-3-phosphate dehydrogenase (NAD(P)+)
MQSPSSHIPKQPVGVIGSGNFGTVIANLLAENRDVWMYTRRQEVVEAIEQEKVYRGQMMHPRIKPVTDLAEMAGNCSLIFPMLPSKFFRETMRQIGPHLTPAHILIHGTKGLDVQMPQWLADDVKDFKLQLYHVKRMSQVISEESPVVRIGCISGPNLSSEISKHLPAGTVIASHFNEVIEEGKAALRSDRFMVFENDDLIGVELAGVLKNILALGSGMVSGLELGENARALMITRGWRELMRIAELFGSDKNAFMGLAGIGDMIATCSSPQSRNYAVGFRLAQGESLEQIISSMDEVAEGVNTVRTAMGLIRHYEIHSPLIRSFHLVLFEGVPIKDAIKGLLTHKHGPDVDFM